MSIFVEDPPAHHHPTPTNSDSLFFPPDPLITKNKDAVFVTKYLTYVRII